MTEEAASTPIPDSVTAAGSPATEATDARRDQIFEVLKTCKDPEIGLDIINLGLIYGMDIREDEVDIRMTLTAMGCPWAGELMDEIKAKVASVPGIEKCNVELVYSPPWSPELMTDEARFELGYI
jgi:metal-sulfur cluster biosynthetic enzyme